MISPSMFPDKFFNSTSSWRLVRRSFVRKTLDLINKGYEVLYLTEAVNEYTISALPEFELKKFKNVAKEGFSIDGDTDAAKARKEKSLMDKYIQMNSRPRRRSRYKNPLW